MKITLKKDEKHNSLVHVFLQEVDELSPWEIGSIWKRTRRTRKSVLYTWLVLDTVWGEYEYRGNRYDRKAHAVQYVLGIYLHAQYKFDYLYALDVAEEILNHQ